MTDHRPRTVLAIAGGTSSSGAASTVAGRMSEIPELGRRADLWMTRGGVGSGLLSQ
jgi:hypothetical protein